MTNAVKITGAKSGTIKGEMRNEMIPLHSKAWRVIPSCPNSGRAIMPK